MIVIHCTNRFPCLEPFSVDARSPRDDSHLASSVISRSVSQLSACHRHREVPERHGTISPQQLCVILLTWVAPSTACFHVGDLLDARPPALSRISSKAVQTNPCVAVPVDNQSLRYSTSIRQKFAQNVSHGMAAASGKLAANVVRDVNVDALSESRGHLPPRIRRTLRPLHTL
jgi:hypothetical protein